jgi:hypothetical protein
MYSSTCFGRPHAYHQELNNYSSSLWFYRWSVVIAVLLVVLGPTGQTTTKALLSSRSSGKTRGCYCSCWAPDDRREDARNTLSCTLTSSIYFFCCGTATQCGSWPPHSWGFLDHRQRRTTFDRNPLDEWSACRRDIYLTTHNRQTSMPPMGFEPTISAGELPQTYVLDRAATGPCKRQVFNLSNCFI